MKTTNYFILISLIFTSLLGYSQVGIGTTTPNTTLEVTGIPADATIPDGIIPPKLTRAQLIAKTAYSTNQTGAMVYISDLSGTTNAATAKVTSIGYYYFSGTTWENLSFSSVKTFTEPITITATTTNPTKATVREQDFINLVDDGSGWCTVTMLYNASSATGAANGSGDYLFSLPASYTFDTTYHPLNTQVAILSGNSELMKILPSTGRLSNSVHSQAVQAVPYSATKFKLMGIYGETSGLTYYRFFSSDYFSIAGTSMHYSITFRFKKG